VPPQELSVRPIFLSFGTPKERAVQAQVLFAVVKDFSYLVANGKSEVVLNGYVPSIEDRMNVLAQ
jgi:hypothetical protein